MFQPSLCHSRRPSSQNYQF